MRYAAFVALSLSLGCGSSDPTASSSAASTPGDSADTSCQVVLRHTTIDFESSLGPQTDCSSGTCWVVITVTFDVAMTASLAQAEAFVLYQGEGSTSWQPSEAQPTWGAPVGFRRHQAVLRSKTFTTGPGDATVHLIPFISTSGTRLFDHNRVGDPMGSYTLDASNDWTINDDASACPGPSPTGTLTATFAAGWANSSTGTLAGGGKLDVSYDVYRMPQTLTCMTDGVEAFATVGYVQFQPSGRILSEVVTGPVDASSKITSLPLEFDVPSGTTTAALWFGSTSDCSAPFWDSDYGQNYVFTAP